MLCKNYPKMTSNSKQNRQKADQRIMKISFLKQLVESVDLKKSVLNKIMTTQEKYIK